MKIKTYSYFWLNTWSLRNWLSSKKDYTNSWLYDNKPLWNIVDKFLDYYHEYILIPINHLVQKVRRDKYVIDDFDTWSLDYSLSKIIHPSLVKFKENMVGFPARIDVNDIPLHIQVQLKARIEREDKGEWYLDSYYWDYILDEMIFAFGEISSDNDDLMFGISDSPYQKRIDNGLRLFSKYYLSLWS